MKKRFLTIMTALFLALIGVTNVHAQMCGVCQSAHTYETPTTSDYQQMQQRITDLQTAGLISEDSTELTISFSHTQSLQDAVGLTTLLDRYADGVDSLNTAFGNSGIKVNITLFDGDPLVVGPSSGNISEVLDSIQENNAPYDIINDHKRCNNVHINVHHVDPSYNGSGGIAGQGLNNGIILDVANTVNKYSDNFQTFVYLLLHEVGHNLGMGHEDGEGNGAFSYSHAFDYLDVSDPSDPISWQTIMWHEYLGHPSNNIGMIPVFSNVTTSYQGHTIGNESHNNAETANLVAPLLAAYFEFNYEVTASTTTVCPGETVDLELVTDEGDEYMWEGDNISGAGQSVTFATNTPGTYDIIGSTKNSSEGSCIWKADTISIQVLSNTTGMETYTGCESDGYDVVVNGTMYDESTPSGMETLLNANGCDSVVSINLMYLPHTVIPDSIITINPGQTVTLPNGELITDQDDGKTGSFVLEGEADNGCNIVVNYTVDVMTAIIELKMSGIGIYPNPTPNGIITVESDIPVKNIIVYTTLGHTCMAENLGNDIWKLPYSCPSGILFGKIELSNGNNVPFKIISISIE